MPSIFIFPGARDHESNSPLCTNPTGVIWNSNLTEALLAMSQSPASLRSFWKGLESSSSGNTPISTDSPGANQGLCLQWPLGPLISVGWPHVVLYKEREQTKPSCCLCFSLLTLDCQPGEPQTLLSIQSVRLVANQILHWCQARQEINHFLPKQMCQNQLLPWGPTKVFHDLGSLTHDKVGNVGSPVM